MRGRIIERGIIFGMIVLLIITCIPSGSNGKKSIGPQHEILLQDSHTAIRSEKTPSVTFYTIGKHSVETQHLSLTPSETQTLYDTYQNLIKEMTVNPKSENTMRLQEQIADLLLANKELTDILTKNQLLSFLRAPSQMKNPLHTPSTPFQTKASEWFCNFVSTGTGSAFPIIILPRLIPFLLTPIPRAFVWWSTPEGITSVGGLISRTGFLAGGQQKGIALGFWGIGFSIFLPPIMSYGLFGYALYTRVTAEVFEFYPPNTPPEITQTDPADGEQMVPVTTTELRFEIHDADDELMSYTVTTEPNIGTGSGGLKPDGVYSVPVSGLESLTTYTWYIEVTDEKDTTENTITFTTEPAAPIISNPLPENGDRDVPMNLPQLQFTLKDYQGDAMEFTVQTSPDIGSDHKVGVHDGTYTVPLSGMTYGAEYCWYVNVTDGTYWTRKMYSFVTGYPSPFNPFEYGWQYRKQIIIDHSQVAGDLENFPVVISTTDPDLMKAQADGDDFLFMSGVGPAVKLRHELEDFNQATGTLTAWVNIPSLSSEDDMVFYMYYGNPYCINQEYPEKVWNNQYSAVWHLNNNPIEGVIDSTLNHNDGTSQGDMTSSDVVTGKIGLSLDFDGINDYISFSEFTESMDTGTCIAWIKTTSNAIGAVWGEAKKTTDKPYIVCGKYYDDKLWFARDISGGSSNYQGFRPNGMNDGQWHQVAWLSKGSGYGNTFYFDGQLTSLTWQDGNDPNGIWFDDQSTNTHSIGALDRPNSRSHWNGLLDEIRIAHTPFSTAWITTEYTNQNNPASFLTIGIEESRP